MTRTLLLIGALAAAACSGPTGYTRKDTWSPEYGYGDKPMGDDEYSVIATGNAHTPPQRAAEIAMLRAAHLAREQGRNRFVIVTAKSRVLEAIKTDSLAVPIGGILLLVPVQERREGEPTAVLIIRLLPEGLTPVPEGALDAAWVIEQLTPHFD